VVHVHWQCWGIWADLRRVDSRVELGYDPEFTWNISNIGNIGNNTQMLKFGVWGIYIECFMRIFVNMQWSRE